MSTSGSSSFFNALRMWISIGYIMDVDVW